MVIVDGNQETFMPVPWTDPLVITGGEVRGGLLYDGRTQLCHLPSPLMLINARELVHNFTAHLLVAKRRFAGPVPMPTCPLQRAKGARCEDGFADRWSRWQTGMFPVNVSDERAVFTHESVKETTATSRTVFTQFFKERAAARKRQRVAKRAAQQPSSHEQHPAGHGAVPDHALAATIATMPLPTSFAMPPVDVAGQLERMAVLHEKRALNDDEFSAAKAAILRLQPIT